MTRSQAATQLSAYFVRQLAEDPGFDRGLLQAVDVLLGETMPDEQGKGCEHHRLVTESKYRCQDCGVRGRMTNNTFTPSPEAVPPPVEQERPEIVCLCGDVFLTTHEMLLHIEIVHESSHSPALAGRAQIEQVNGTIRSLAYEVGTVLDVARRRSNPAHDDKLMMARLDMWLSRLNGVRDQLSALIAVDTHLPSLAPTLKDLIRALQQYMKDGPSRVEYTVTRDNR